MRIGGRRRFGWKVEERGCLLARFVLIFDSIFHVPPLGIFERVIFLIVLRIIFE